MGAGWPSQQRAEPEANDCWPRPGYLRFVSRAENTHHLASRGRSRVQQAGLVRIPDSLRIEGA